MRHLRIIACQLPVKADMRCQIKAVLAGWLARDADEYDAIMRDKLCH